jgi:myo-inositol-1(or 4)-monophosphatase
MTADPGSLLPVALQAAAAASEMIRTHRPTELTEKADRDLVSDVDLAIEREVRRQLQAATPDVGFLGEEEGRTGNADGAWLWTIDPIDGTANYVHGLPMCATSLALLHNGRAVLAVIDTPFLGQRYHAIDGRGAYTGTTRLAISTVTELHDAVVAIGDYAVGDDAERKNELRLAITTQLARRVHRIRMLGTAAVDLAWVAEGRLDASITLNNNPWDTAPGVLIAREAGAQVVDKNGTPHDINSAATIAAPAPLIGQIVPLIQSLDGDYAPKSEPPYAALDDILSRTSCLILDFDTVVCDLFAGTTPAAIAQQLRDALGADTAQLTAASTPHPLDILAQAAAVSPALAARADAAMTELEMSAVPTAQPAGYVHEVLAACRESGRSAAVVSRHSTDAVRMYVETHGLHGVIDIISRPPGHPYSATRQVKLLVNDLDLRPSEGAVITASAELIRAATGRLHTIGYARTPDTRERLTAAGAETTIASLADLALRLRARRFPMRFPNL